MWLSTENISTDQPSKKLDHKIIGSFEVIKKKNISLKWQLPQAIKIHNVFDLNFFRKALTDLLIGQVDESALLMIINNKEDWKVEDIFDARNL